MTWKERWLKIMAWRGCKPKSSPLARISYNLYRGIGIHTRRAGQAQASARKDGESEALAPGERLMVSAWVQSPFRVLVVKCQDSVGELTATIQGPDGAIRSIAFNADDPFHLPPEFQLLQVGTIGGSVRLDSPNDSPGAVVAQALRRFNANVLRMADFGAAVSDEVNSVTRVPQVSTVWADFGEGKNRQHLEITVQRTNRERPDMVRGTPLVAKGKGE